jgi:hypothetical protein
MAPGRTASTEEASNDLSSMALNLIIEWNLEGTHYLKTAW